jgi:hypothetical protein
MKGQSQCPRRVNLLTDHQALKGPASFLTKRGGDLPMFVFRTKIPTNLTLFVWRVHEITKQMHISHELPNKLA